MMKQKGVKGARGQGLRGTAICFLWLGVFCLFPQLAPAGDSNSKLKTQNSKLKKQVFLVVLNYVTFQDLYEARLPTLKYLIQNSSVGLLNTRSGSGYVPGGCFLSIGTSSRALGGQEIGEAFNATELVENHQAFFVYRRRMGTTGTWNSVFMISYPQVLFKNEKASFEVHPGALGQAVKDAGLKTAVFGNGDNPVLFHREAAVLVADRAGIVHFGDVSQNMLESHPDYPFGLRTNVHRLYVKFQKLLWQGHVPSLVAFELGDMQRLVDYKLFLTEASFGSAKQKILEHADVFLRQLLAQADSKNTMLILFSPMPDVAAKEEGFTLSPILVHASRFPAGLLTSASTRWNGVVTNMDIAPTVLEFLGTPAPSFFYGRSMNSTPRSETAAHLFFLEQRLRFSASYNTPLLRTFIIYQVLVVAFCLLSLVFKHKFPAYCQTLAYTMLVSLFALPFCLLLLPVFSPPDFFFAFLLLLVLAVFFVVLSKKVAPEPLHTFVFFCGLTSFALLIDCLFRSPLMRHSALGFSVMQGSRYYGIGNEYMGILVSAGLLGSALLLDLQRVKELDKEKQEFIKKGIFAFYMLVLVVISFPRLGANVGGGITAAAGFGMALLLQLKMRVSLRMFYIFAASVFLLILLLGMLDYFSASRSHLGNALAHVQASGPGALFEIIMRKVEMNFRLIQYTSWNKMLISCMVVVLVLYFRPGGKMKELLKSYPNIHAGLFALCAASFAGFFFNDSGIIVLATGVEGIAVTFLLLFFVDSLRQKEGGESGCN